MGSFLSASPRDVQSGMSRLTNTDRDARCRIVSVSEVRSAFLVSGRYDLVVHVVVQDTRHLKDLALDQFTNRPGVTRIETSIIFDARKRYELPVFRSLE
jgi:DNA-binding Lrp family transcriptional regulator